jgi:hypothetical protein
MARFDFERPYVAPSQGSMLAGAVTDFLGQERQRRKDKQEQSNFERTAGQADRRIDQEDVRIDQGAIEAGFDLNRGRGHSESAETTEVGEMPDGDEYSPPRMGPFPGDEIDPGFEAPRPVATASGRHPGVQVPTADEARHPRLGARDYRRSTGGMATLLQDELTKQRDARARAQSESDRTRRIGQLEGMGRDAPTASAIVDRDVNFDDVVPELDRPGFEGAYRRKTNIDTGAAISRALGSQRARNQADREEGGRAPTRADLDRATDNARQDLVNAENRLRDLQRLPIPYDEAEANAHQAAIQQAREEVSTLHTRAGTYRAQSDSAFARTTGAKFDQGGAKTPSPEQLQRAQRDPQYGEFLSSQGYQMPQAKPSIFPAFPGGRRP